MSDLWEEIGLDQEGFVHLTELKERWEHLDAGTLPPALLVQAGLVARERDGVEGANTDLPSEDTRGFDDSLDNYQDRLCFLLKRPGAPFVNMITLGRGASCDIRISMGAVSKVQAYFLKEGDGWFLVDQRSSNGTFVNKSRLEPGQKHPVKDADQIRFGLDFVGQLVFPESLPSTF